MVGAPSALMPCGGPPGKLPEERRAAGSRLLRSRQQEREPRLRIPFPSRAESERRTEDFRAKGG